MAVTTAGGRAAVTSVVAGDSRLGRWVQMGNQCGSWNSFSGDDRVDKSFQLGQIDSNVTPRRPSLLRG
jgi:hypothetical protein